MKTRNRSHQSSAGWVWNCNKAWQDVLAERLPRWPLAIIGAIFVILGFMVSAEWAQLSALGIAGAVACFLVVAVARARRVGLRLVNGTIVVQNLWGLETIEARDGESVLLRRGRTEARVVIQTHIELVVLDAVNFFDVRTLADQLTQALCTNSPLEVHGWWD